MEKENNINTLPYNSFFTSYETLLENLNKKDISLIEKSIADTTQKINELLQIELEKNNLIKENLKNLLDKTSSWILNNFSSGKLVNIIQIISGILIKCGYRIELSKDDILLSLKLDLSSITDSEKNDKKDKDLNKIDEELIKKSRDTEKEKEKNEEDDNEEKEKVQIDDTILTNQFLNAFYALIVTISNKPEVIIKSKNLVRSCISVFAQLSNIKNVVIFIKKKRLISVFHKIIKELYKNKDSNEDKEQFQVNLEIFLNIYAKIGKNRGMNSPIFTFLYLIRNLQRLYV